MVPAVKMCCIGTCSLQGDLCQQDHKASLTQSPKRSAGVDFKDLTAKRLLDRKHRTNIEKLLLDG